MALPLLLFCLLALTALATIAMHAARQEIVIARASYGLLRARTSAEGAIRLAVADVPSARLLAMEEGFAEAILEGDLAPNGRYELNAHRMRFNFFMLESMGFTAVEDGAVVRVGRLVWALDPASVVAAFHAALEHGGNAPVGDISGHAAATSPEEWPSSVCSGFRSALDSIFPFGGTADSAPVPDEAAANDPVLGILTLADLLDLADRPLQGEWTPRPETVDGACASTLASNWGAPTDPEGACGSLFPLIVSPGSLHLGGGEAQGVMVVADDLEMSGNMSFAGLLIVGGDMTLVDDARIDGLVRVGGSVEMMPDTSIRGSGCAALRALHGNPALTRLLPVSAGSWLGGF